MLLLNLDSYKNAVNRFFKNNVIKKLFKQKFKGGIYYSADFITYVYLGLMFLFTLFSFFYIGFYYTKLPSQIPLWYSLIWGADRLSIKQYIFIIPSISLVIFLASSFYSYLYLKSNIKEVARFISTLSFVSVLFLTLSTLNIVNSTVAIFYVLGEAFSGYFLPFLIALILSFISTRFVIKYAYRLKIIEYPKLRKEPQGVLSSPTPRGGAIPFFIAFAITTLIFLSSSQKAIGLVLGTLITTITGYLDDRYKLSYLPRLIFLLPLAFLIVILSGFVTFYIPNPFGEAIKLDGFRLIFEFLGSQRSIVVYGAIFSFIWFMWMANMLSWNNGIDGQFVAISSSAVLAIAILSFRFGILTYEQELSAKLSLIALGSILGLFWYTFPPQKIIWGFGATGVGLVIAALSILSGTRVASAFLVLLIPSIDTIYVLINRIKNRKSPFMGDANHLHHKLIMLGLSRRQIALIYWGISFMFLGITISTSENLSVLLLLTLSGLALYLILLVRRYAKKFNKVTGG